MRKYLFLVVLLNLVYSTFSNPKISFIIKNIPKSPESNSFNKYDNIPVGEFTGTSNLRITLLFI